MAPSTPANHDPALSHGAPAASAQQPPAQGGGMPTNLSPADISSMHLNGLDQNQIMNLLRSLPGVFTKLTEGQATPKEDAAQTLSNLAQAPSPFGAPHMPVHYQPSAPGLPGINDPGPSSHPRGPPNLGQLSAVATMQAAPSQQQQAQQQAAQQQAQQQGLPPPGGAHGDDNGADGNMSSGSPSGKEGGEGEGGQASASAPTGGRRGGRTAAMGSDEWSRQRKDNHKEVERRRRGNINEGINELGRIVPSGSGEKAKGAILSRAVQYIHHLKENEARNIEKWTLEKLLMDQAMGDLQAQLEEIKRLWEEERMARTRLEAELEVLRSMNGMGGAAQVKDEAAKRRAEEGGEETQEERDGKRQRTE